jgi:hypothetical protein
MFFSSLPPPTEKTNTQSLALNLLICSQLIKVTSHPSSLTRAVNSDILSYGAYASILQSFLKSQTAWEAWPAPPPEPIKNHSATIFPYLGKHLSHFFYYGVIKVIYNLPAFIKKCLGKIHI